jgi:hypothetical protein
MPFPVVIPLLAVGTLALLARSRGASRSSSITSTSASDQPSPITVMGAFLYMGERPPQSVVFAAIAQAESLGRADLADDIVRAFVLPDALDDEGEAMNEHGSEVYLVAENVPPPGIYSHTQPPGMYPAVAPLAYAPAAPAMYQPVPPSAYGPAAAPAMYQPVAAPVSPLAYPPATAFSMYSQPAAAVPPMAHTPAAAPTMYAPAMYAPTASPPAATLTYPSAAPVLSDGDVQFEEAQRVLAEVAHAGRHAAKVELLPRAGAAAEPETITVSGKSSPIQGVETEAWSEFVGRVSRELPTFAAAHHVGQFRQRRERLAELGIDPSSIIDSPDAQRAALDAEIGDAYEHARSSGLVDEYIGAVLDVSNAGATQPAAVTLSGVLGVIQAAGLEGAVQWLEHPADRARFPNTTQAFLRCNGVF